MIRPPLPLRIVKYRLSKYRISYQNNAGNSKTWENSRWRRPPVWLSKLADRPTSRCWTKQRGKNAQTGCSLLNQTHLRLGPPPRSSNRPKSLAKKGRYHTAKFFISRWQTSLWCRTQRHPPPLPSISPYFLLLSKTHFGSVLSGRGREGGTGREVHYRHVP